MSGVFSEIWRLLSNIEVPVFGGNGLTFAGLITGVIAVSVSVTILIKYFKDF